MAKHQAGTNHARKFELARAFNKAAPPPKAPRDNTADIYHGTTVPDPFRPLEQLDAPATSAFVDAQNERFAEFIAGAPRRQATIDFLDAAWNYPSESLPSRYGKNIFTFYNDGKSNQSLYQVREGKNAAPRTLIDPAEWAADGTAALSGVYPSPDGTKVAYTLAMAGSDEISLRLRDVKTGKDLPDRIDGLRFTGARWDKDGKGFSYNALAADGKRRFVAMHHKLGDAPARDKLVFELDEQDCFVGGFQLRKGSHDWMSVSIGTLPMNGLWARKTGTDDKFEKIFNHSVARYSPVAEINGKIYMVTDHGAPRGRLVAFDPANPEPQNWQDIIPEHKTDTLDGAFLHQNRLFVYRTHDAADRLAVHQPDGHHLHDVALPPQSTFGFARIHPHDKKLLLSISNFQQPGAQYEYNIARNALTLVKPSAAPQQLNDCVVERISARSKDGTMVPMTVIRHPDTKLDGSAALKLYGYGGFNMPLGPGYSLGVASWIRAGGIYVQANLRGGGEAGRPWYDGGRLHNKQNVFDDLAACADLLAQKKYTSPARTVIAGGSNGGLLTLATMLQYPEKFGAVISAVPVTDMYRFHKHTYGAAWKSDYGDPESIKKDFETAAKYSPLHNVKKGATYPPTLVTTGDHDDRVVPSHAYKFIATLQQNASKDTLALLRVEKDAGHGAGKPKDKTIAEMAEVQSFIEKAIGPLSQSDYKKSLKRGPGL